MNYIYSKRPDIPVKSPMVQTPDETPANLSNSAMASLLGDMGSGDSSALDAAMRVRVAALNRQRPAAEREADRLSAGVTATTPEQLKVEMGQRMGANFSNVRFHSGPSSVQEGDRMGARAWTKGNDVYFGEGGFDPGVAAHELVHTVQQGSVAGQASESAPAGTIQMMPNPFKWIKRKIQNSKEKKAQKKAAARAELKPERNQKRPWEMTKKDFKDNHYNPGDIDEIAEIQSQIDAAQTPQEAYRTFLAYTGNTNGDGVEVKGQADQEVDLNLFKNKLKNMSRMVYDYPELKDRIGVMEMYHNDKSGTSMIAHSVAASESGRSKLEYNIHGDRKGVGGALSRFNTRNDERISGFSAADTSYDGNHELGHVLNSLMFRPFTASDDWTFNVTADCMLQQVLASVTQDPIQYHQINSDQDPENMSRQEADQEHYYAGQVDLGASRLKSKGITSGYGETDAGEFFAEAFADVYAHGDKARKASIELVKLYEGHKNRPRRP